MSPQANIIVATAQVPFSRGGAEILVDQLCEQLRTRGHSVEVVQVPFFTDTEEDFYRQIAIWQSLKLDEFSGKKVDLVIATKFPSYLINHPNKVLWLVHQHRPYYDLYGSRFGESGKSESVEALRRHVYDVDKASIKAAKSCFTISKNVSDRLREFFDLSSTPLLPPLPLGDAYHEHPSEPYILSVGRLCSIKRVDLAVKALAKADKSLKLKIVGANDEARFDEYLKNEIDKHHLWERVEFLGRVGNEELLELYAKSRAVFYAPFDEDYGFVTLEGLASGKPILTCHDSGGVLSFIEDGVNGLIVDPSPEALARAFDSLQLDESLYKKLSDGARTSPSVPSWDEVVGELTRSLT